MTSALFLIPEQQITEGVSAIVAPGAEVNFYLTGTLTRAPVYSDASLTTLRSNPVLADALGRVPETYINTALTYRVIIEDEDGIELSDTDPYSSSLNLNGIDDALEIIADALTTINADTTESATNATNANASSVASANSAAAAAALYAGRLFTSAGAGDTGTSAGQSYLVTNGGNPAKLTLWLHNGTGGADQHYTVPSAAMFDYVAPTGSMKYVRGTGDIQGTLINAIDAAGTVYAPPPDIPKKRGSYRGTLDFFPIDGQSESVGQAPVAISTQTRYSSAKMFHGGMVPQYNNAGASDATNYGSFVSAAEVTSTVNTALGESFCTSALEAIIQLIEDEDGVKETDHDYRLLTSAPGLGATAIAGLSKGTTPYTRLLLQVQYAYDNERATGGSPRVSAVGWVHGVNNAAFTPAAYLTPLQQLQTDANTDIKAITGQIEDVSFILGQISSHKQSGQVVPGPALGMLAAAMADPAKFTLAGPMYPYEYQSSNNNVHLQNYGEKAFGAVLGYARKRRINDGVLWKPVCPTGAVTTSADGKRKIFTFNVPDDRFGNPDELVWDTTNVLENTNYGLEAVASDGVTLLTQLKPVIVDRDKVMIEVPTGWPVGARLQGAWRGAGTVGPLTGPRSNLRAKRETIIDPHGFATVVRHWCVHFDIAA